MIFEVLERREKPEKFTKYKIIVPGSNTTKSKQKIDYEYYMCDNCKSNFKVNNKKWHEREGGILEYPISDMKSVKLAICNKCLKDTLKELDEHYRGGRK